MGRRGPKKYSEKHKLSEDAIGAVHIYKNKGARITVHLDKECIDAIGARGVIFGRHNMTLTPATVEKEGFHITANGNFGCSVNKISGDDICGVYEMVEEGKHFKLYRIEKEED